MDSKRIDKCPQIRPVQFGTDFASHLFRIGPLEMEPVISAHFLKLRTEPMPRCEVQVGRLCLARVDVLSVKIEPARCDASHLYHEATARTSELNAQKIDGIAARPMEMG